MRKILWRRFLPGVLICGAVWGAVLLNVFCSRFYPYRVTISSPSGTYAIEQRYTDFLSAGYRGKTFLVTPRGRWFVDNFGPGYTSWVSDTAFIVTYDAHHITEYHVSDFDKEAI